MVTKTENIIYDTNYTNIVSDGGFVDNQFATQKTWFLNLLFWSSSKKLEDSKKETTDKETKASSTQNQAQVQDVASQQDNTKTPWFFDLLFWNLNPQKHNVK